MDESELAGLLRKGMAGDEASYARFLSAVAPVLRGFVMRRAGGTDIEDVVQETLLAIHLKRHTWRQDAPVKPWIFAIARHKTVDAFRRRGRRIEIDIDAFAEVIPAPEPEIVSEREVGRILDGLAPGQRAVVTSISVEGRSIGETAAALGMQETAVRVALHRGLSAIKKRFARD
jgi:RNA polymerase sigma-70 factor (ECF subfamily)